jgi:hypothetical protein
MSGSIVEAYLFLSSKSISSIVDKDIFLSWKPTISIVDKDRFLSSTDTRQSHQLRSRPAMTSHNFGDRGTSSAFFFLYVARKQPVYESSASVPGKSGTKMVCAPSLHQR